MPRYGYNFPWSGRIGRIETCCPYCGRDDILWHISSIGRCLAGDCNSIKIIPELKQKFNEEAVKRIRAWCDERNIDYEATVKNYHDNLGPPLQERDTPIPNADKDYTVYKTDHDSKVQW